MCHCRQTDEALGLAPAARVLDSGGMSRQWLLAATLVAVGCSAPCRSSEVCAVTGHDGDTQVCDGDHWRTCAADDGNHGLHIACKTQPKTAVCTTDGWTFEDGPAP
jgi:hypothetical protein